jgi:protocatechuate 3,4-dioxygenase beta subunit
VKISLPIFFVAAALFAQQSPPKPEDLCGIAGQATNAATGAPVKKAELVLTRIDADPQTTYSAATDRDGKFAMRDIEPGKYRLSIRANGFVEVNYGARGHNLVGTALALDAGQILKDVNPKLTPQGVIAGRIVDEDGDPVVHAEVAAQSYRRVAGRKRLVPAGTASTNDLGEYRIFGLAPGRYYVSATTLRPSSDRSAIPPPDESEVPTYYPGGIDIATAVAVDAPPGADLHAMNIILAKTHTVRVRGHVNNPGGGRPNVIILLTPRDRSGSWGVGDKSGADAQGNFEFRGVRPGIYWLETRFLAERTLFMRQVIEVGNGNIDDVAVTLTPGVDLKGLVKAEGPDGGVDLAGIHIVLQARDAADSYPRPYGRGQGDGTFTLLQVGPEHYDFYLSGLPEGYYVKSVRPGDQEVRDSGLDMTAAPAGPLSVTIAPGAGRIDGIVVDDQQAAAGALVVLIPDDARRRARRDSYPVATTDQYGLFTLKNINPGEYKLYAWDDIESEAYMDPDFMKPFESRGLPMSIHENSKETAQLALISAVP